VVSCGAINSAALAASLGERETPRVGLANSSDIVGRHYMGHVNSVAVGNFEVSESDAVPEDGLAVNDFYLGARSGIIRWGIFRFVAKAGTELRCPPGAPAITPGWTLDLMADHALSFWLTSEDLPDPNNRVTLDRDGRIVLQYTAE